jgi:hypothetical protein
VVQVLAAPIALQFGGVSAPGTNQRLADHVWTLWHERVQSAPFRFGSPAMLARDIEDSKSLPTPEAKLRAVLRTVVRSLDVRLRDSTRAWLDGGSGGEEKPPEPATPA